MSGQLRALKKRIRSVESTQKITKAMEMISAAKLHRYRDLMIKGRTFAGGLENLLARISRSGKISAAHPFFEKREEKRTGLLLITSDTGLCGAYNLELVHRARAFLETQKNPAPLIGVGKFGIRFLKRLGYSFYRTFSDIKTAQVEPTLLEVKNILEKLYLEKTADAIRVIYGHFLSASSFSYASEKLLPFDPFEGDGKTSASGADYIFEPDQETIFARLIPLFFEAKVRQIFLEAFVSEQTARMQAMHLATENASEMLTALVIHRNKVRQASITGELIEIISGAQALKGK